MFVEIGLGVAVLVEAIKILTPWILSSSTKIAFTLALCAGSSYAMVHGWRAITLTAMGSLGIAHLTHRSGRYLLAAGDDHRSAVMFRHRFGHRSRQVP